ncbi:MAG: hypothetical protein AB2L20_27635 [Mangrovibacterium sp.]
MLVTAFSYKSVDAGKSVPDLQACFPGNFSTNSGVKVLLPQITRL